MSDKIVGLRDRKPPLANGVEPEVVEVLELALERARRGDTVAIAIVEVERDGTIGSVVRNPGNSRHLLVAGCVYAQHDIMAAGKAK